MCRAIRFGRGSNLGERASATQSAEASRNGCANFEDSRDSHDEPNESRAEIRPVQRIGLRTIINVRKRQRSTKTCCRIRGVSYVCRTRCGRPFWSQPSPIGEPHHLRILMPEMTLQLAVYLVSVVAFTATAAAFDIRMQADSQQAHACHFSARGCCTSLAFNGLGEGVFKPGLIGAAGGVRGWVWNAVGALDDRRRWRRRREADGGFERLDRF